MILRIVMATSNRKPEYVHASLESLFEGASEAHVHLVVCGASDSGYLSRWQGDSRVTIHEAGEGAKMVAEKSFVERRILQTFLRGLSLAEPNELFVFLEDDIVFAKDWLKKLEWFVKLSETRDWQKPNQKDRFILTLCSMYQVKSDRSMGKHSVGEYHPSHFHCTAALAMKTPVVCELLSYAAEKIAAGEWLASDMMVKHFAWEKNCDIVSSNPSIVDHTGDQSSQGFFDIRRANSFERE